MSAVSLDLIALLPPLWREALVPHLDPALMARLGEYVGREYAQEQVFPPLADLYAAMRLCSPAQTRVLVLGQDPYHRAGQAHGLSFSVPTGVAVPPSLRSVFAEIGDDLGVTVRPGGDLTGWAEQGVLLLNAVLTVRAGKPASHAGKGWEHLTDAAIRVLDEQPGRVVFLLWGNYARQKAALITNSRHAVLEAGHPSPMNPRGFRGTRPFSACNAALAGAGREPIDWAAH
jgi:uracil-DNA glycosylase